MRRGNRIDGRERQPARRPTTVDIIDRVLDKGMVIEYHGGISVGGIDTLATIDARYVVSSFDTSLQYGETLRSAGLLPRTRLSRRLLRNR